MSLWIIPAACQTDNPERRCHDCAGLSSPAVKNATRFSSENAPRTTVASPDSLSPRSARIAAASSSSSSPSSDSSRADTATAAAPCAAA